MNSETGPSESHGFTPTANFADQRISQVYAEALMDAAEQQKAVEEVKSELHELVHGLFQKQPDFEPLLASGIISRGHKLQLLQQVFENKTSSLFYNFLMVLADHDRLTLFRPLHQAFHKLYDQRQRRIPVLVTSAVALTEEQTNRLKENLHSNFDMEPILHTRVDPDILGGVIVKVADWVFDRSVRSQLNNIRKQLLAKGSHVITSGRDRISPN